MYQVSILEQGPRVEIGIAAILGGTKFDLPEIRDALTKIVQEGNRRDRLAGVDRDGSYLIGLAESTLKRRTGDPTPFVEHGEASRVIRNLLVIVETSPGQVEISFSWVGCPWIRFHMTGGPHLPVRNFVGESDDTLRAIDRAVLDALDARVHAAIANSPSSRFASKSSWNPFTWGR